MKARLLICGALASLAGWSGSAAQERTPESAVRFMALTAQESPLLVKRAYDLNSNIDLRDDQRGSAARLLNVEAVARCKTKFNNFTVDWSAAAVGFTSWQNSDSNRRDHFPYILIKDRRGSAAGYLIFFESNKLMERYFTAVLFLEKACNEREQTGF